MLLQHPEPFSNDNPQITEKMPAILMPKSVPERDWTPPPYWRSLLQDEESKFEYQFKKWITRIVLVAAIIYLLLLASIPLLKLLITEALK